jgi:hypothetical protein
MWGKEVTQTFSVARITSLDTFSSYRFTLLNVILGEAKNYLYLKRT